MSAAAPLLSVVIPAHNEAAVIGRSLGTLLAGAADGEFEVIVACNGCTDGTADVVRGTGLPVTVIEVEQASKIAALRAADAVATVFPRLYLDADVDLPAASLRALAARLAVGDVLAGRPPFVYDTAGAKPLVRSYYRARARVPEVLGSLWGAGAYAVTERGHARITPWPDVMADDLYVDRSFTREEITVVDAAPVVVRVPRTVGTLVRVLGRANAGTQELLPAPERPTQGSTMAGLLRSALRRPDHAPDAVVYAGFAVAARLDRRRRLHAAHAWARDETSRSAV